jgi:DNA-binding transcriptional ArsR family regulator
VANCRGSGLGGGRGSPTSDPEGLRTDMAVPLYQAKAELFRTLGHPARIRILELLCEGPHAVHALREQVEIEASNLSQQLSVLRKAQMVVSTRRDGEVVYSISVPEVRDLLLAGRRILAQLAPEVDLDWAADSPAGRR